MKMQNKDKDRLYDFDELEMRKAKSKENLVTNILKSILITIITIGVSYWFFKMNFNEATIILIYILGVFFTAITTEGYLFGIISSIINVLLFNYLCTEPYYTFFAYRADYPVTFLIMLIVAIITSTLTSKVKHEAMVASLREERIKELYKSNKKLLSAECKKQVVDFSGESLVEMINRNVIICLVKNDEISERNIYYSKDNTDNKVFKSYTDREAIKYSYKKEIPCGVGTDYYKNIANYYYPIKGQNEVIGVIGINLQDEVYIRNTDRILLESVSVQLAIAIERERLFEKNRSVSFEAERERIRGNLLRSISHDLRTPITSILGSTLTIMDNYEILDSNIKKELLNNIYEDTVWLSQSFENILSMTRIDEGKLELKKSMEIVDDIITESVAKVEKFSKSHNISLSFPEEIIIINVDRLLIVQVLVNLIQNAVRYTPVGSNIKIKGREENGNVVFEVEDNGEGIAEEYINSIFERFYTKTKSEKLEQRGIGLGLAICKSIIQAHNGEIHVFNNQLGGATFSFSLPTKGEI